MRSIWSPPTSGSSHEAQNESLLWSSDFVGCLEHLLGCVHLISLWGDTNAHKHALELQLSIHFFKGLVTDSSSDRERQILLGLWLRRRGGGRWGWGLRCGGGLARGFLLAGGCSSGGAVVGGGGGRCTGRCRGGRIRRVSCVVHGCSLLVLARQRRGGAGSRRGRLLWLASRLQRVPSRTACVCFEEIKSGIKNGVGDEDGFPPGHNRRSTSYLAASRSWECRRRMEPCWVWRAGNWSTAEGFRSGSPVSKTKGRFTQTSVPFEEGGGFSSKHTGQQLEGHFVKICFRSLFEEMIYHFNHVWCW